MGSRLMHVDEYRDAYDLIGIDPRDSVLSEVDVELSRQDEKWGEQNHPDIRPGRCGSDRLYFEDRSLYDSEARWWKRMNDDRVSTDSLAWDGILLEEVYEALAESDPAKLRAELVQVAAVAVQWIAAIDRRNQ